MSGIQKSCKLKGVVGEEKLRYIEELDLIYKRVLRSAGLFLEENSNGCLHCSENQNLEEERIDLENDVDSMEYAISLLSDYADQQLEQVFNDADIITNLFSDGSIVNGERFIEKCEDDEGIIKQLRHSIFVASKGFIKKVFTTQEQKLIEDLMDACVIEAKNTAQENFSTLKSILVLGL